MTEYLCGDLQKPPVTSPTMWNFLLPSMEISRGRAVIQEYRCKWSLSVVFGSVMSFANYDALRVDTSPVSRHKLFTVQGRQQLTLFHGSPTWLPLRVVELRASGVHALVIKMPRVGHHFGSACAVLHDVTGVGGVGRRLDSCLRLEMLHVAICSLHHALLSAGCVWLVSDECLEFLESFHFIPPLRYDCGDWISEIRRHDLIKMFEGGMWSRCRLLVFAYGRSISSLRVVGVFREWLL